MGISEPVGIRECAPSDRQAILALYARAFPDEDLTRLVTTLLEDVVNVLSLAAILDDAIIGHAACTFCGLEGHNTQLALLGPLAVEPDHQKRGIGSTLIRAGSNRVQTSNAARICVLGDPAYYGKFGFTPETGVDPPYLLPNEWRGAWQSLNLSKDNAVSSGRLTVPAPWRDPALWGA
ncbi:MAG: N-acetyltransferase [Rhodospirillales bacterium]